MKSSVCLWLSVVFALMMFTGCYDNKVKSDHVIRVKPIAEELDSVKEIAPFDSIAYKRKLDSLLFVAHHHYHENYNFLVKSDSMVLCTQQPEEVVSGMAVDSFAVYRHDRLVVADIRIMPADSIDSVWVQLARDQITFGWIHEADLLARVMPADPISQFISTFSDKHTLIFLIVITLMAAAYLLRKILRRNAKIVHFNDIDSIYPTILTVSVAISATLYASIQLFAPDIWQHFYFHPTLNPFNVPFILTLFLLMVWFMLIVGIACIDVVRTRLPFGDALLYLGGLLAVCAVNYIVFSLTTLYYIGYPLLVAYVYYALLKYHRHSHCRYVCGHCGAPLRQKGRCPHCGTVNQ